MGTKSSSKGCVIALVVVAILGLLFVGGSIVAITFLGRAADETIGEALDEGIPGVVGGDCLQFQFAYSSLTMSALFTAGADDAQVQELEDALADMQANVPDEIADDVAIVSDAFRESMQLGIQGGLAGGREPSDDDLAEAEAVLESPEVVEAQDNIDAWLIENCS